MKSKLSLLLPFLSAIALTLAALAAGAGVSSSVDTPVFGVTELIQCTNKPWGREIILEGFPTAVCRRSGKKAWLHDTNSEAAGTVRVERTADMPAFNQEVVGRTIRVTGILRELRVDSAYLDAWEARVKAAANKPKSGESDEENCTEQCQENVAADKTLKTIAAFRGKLAKSQKSHLSGLWVDGIRWELVETGAKQ